MERGRGPAGRCDACGGPLRARVVPEFRDDALVGLPGLVLVNAVTETVCSRCRRRADLTIPNLWGALAAAGIVRVMNPIPLSGAEFRALRRVVGYTAKKLAALLEVRPETLSRWETGAEPIGPAHEKLARLLLGNTLDQRAPTLVVFDPATLLAMPLRAPRGRTRRAVIRLELVPLPDAPGAGAWEEAQRAA
jgi:transcriptional regulator with XRE-family HTH domain